MICIKLSKEHLHFPSLFSLLALDRRTLRHRKAPGLGVFPWYDSNCAQGGPTLGLWCDTNCARGGILMLNVYEETISLRGHLKPSVLKACGASMSFFMSLIVFDVDSLCLSSQLNLIFVSVVKRAVMACP